MNRGHDLGKEKWKEDNETYLDSVEGGEGESVVGMVDGVVGCLAKEILRAWKTLGARDIKGAKDLGRENEMEGVFGQCRTGLCIKMTVPVYRFLKWYTDSK